MGELANNLERIRELSKTVVPFSYTIKGVEMLDASTGKRATLKAIHKEPEFAIAIAEVEANFTHQDHFHEEIEILVLLKGDAYCITNGKGFKYRINSPVIIDKRIPHENHFLTDSKVLAITIPASLNFPEVHYG